MLERTIEPGGWMALKPERSTPGERATPLGSTPFDDLAAVHALYEARIFRFLLLSLRDRDAALSLTQDTFLKAWRARASFRGECAVATWLMRIAVNLLRDHTRTEMFRFWKRAAETAVDAGDAALGLVHPARSAEQRLLAEERLERVWATVEALTAKQRAVFLLRFVEEMELQDIAAATGMTLVTVKTHLHRALDHIRRVEKAAANATRMGTGGTR